MTAYNEIKAILEKLDSPDFVGYLGAEDPPEDRYEKLVGESDNPEDVISVDVPLLIRLLEYAREDAQTDMDLHDVAEKLISLSKDGKTLSMEDYDNIVSKNS